MEKKQVKFTEETHGIEKDAIREVDILTAAELVRQGLAEEVGEKEDKGPAKRQTKEQK